MGITKKKHAKRISQNILGMIPNLVYVKNNKV